MNHPVKNIYIYLLIFLSFLSLTKSVSAFTSSSTNYGLEGEFGIFGGAKTSTNYRLTDTGGGFAPGFGDSTNYRSCSGFQCVIAEVPKIIVSLSSNTINLGTLSTGAVSTGSHTISVTTNIGGYTTRVYGDGNLRQVGGSNIDNVTDGFINAGDEEYGLATSQGGRDITQDTDCGSSTYAATELDGVNNPKSVAFKNSPTFTAEITTICYAASISGLTEAGSYQQIVTFITTGAF